MLPNTLPIFLIAAASHRISFNAVQSDLQTMATIQAHKEHREAANATFFIGLMEEYFMQFCWVTLPVKNLKTSLAFYNGVLGLPINSKHCANGIEMAMLGEENHPKIELINTL